MRSDILTLFPQMCRSYLAESIIGRALAAEKIDIVCRNIRDYASNHQKQTDDAPYGGGHGMVLAAQPIYDCFETLCKELGARPHLVYMSPAGQTLTQSKVVELSHFDHLAILCGHYEGIDERVIEEIVDEELSVGDYVLTGGELPALIVADAVARMCEGVLAEQACYEQESHYSGLLEHPQYTRPEVWRGRSVPEVLLSGNHAKIEQWKREQMEQRTQERRPDLWKRYIGTL